MPSRAALAAALAASCACTACSEIVGIEDRSGTWCTLEADAYMFCEDFDHDEPFDGWSTSGAPRTGPSDRSEPNALLAPAGALLQRDFHADMPSFVLALDARVTPREPTKPDAPPPILSNDHGVALVSRAGGTVGLFAGTGGALLFGFLSAAPEPIADVSPTDWTRFVISVDASPDATTATLAADGRVVATRKLDEPSGDVDEDHDKESVRIVIGAQRFNLDAPPVECDIDNVLVDDASGPTP